jgi:GGDEF domain-containing protein
MGTLDTTLGLTQLARTWIRRLGQLESDPLAAEDALVVVQGPPEIVGLRLPLDRGSQRILLSRGSLVELQQRAAADPVGLPSCYVSAPHAALEAGSDGWTISDLGSSNHTYVGTVKVQRQRLIYGDEIRVGDVALVYVSAERGAMPPHVVDPCSGLLTSRVFIAEATRLLEGSEDGEPLSLLVVHVNGLRERLAGPRSPGEEEGDKRDSVLIRRAGAELMELFEEGAVLGRLGIELLAAAWKPSDRDQHRDQARRVRQALSALIEPRGLDARCVALFHAGEGARLPQILSCCLAALEGPHIADDDGVMEAELEHLGRFLLDGDLLTRIATERLPVLLALAIGDEDSLRHRIGHDRLGAYRWVLRRLVASSAIDAPLLGVLDQRVFVVGLDHEDPAHRLGEQLRQQLQREMSGDPETAHHDLCFSVLERPSVDDSKALRRQLLAAVEQGGAVVEGERLPVGRLPTPVATPYSLIWVVTSHTARVKTILDAAEVATRFVAAAMVAAVASESAGLQRDQARSALSRRRHRRLPLGEWVALIRELAPAFEGFQGPIAQVLRRSLGISHRGVLLTHLLEHQILPQRNHFTHGELAPREERSAGQASSLLGELNKLLRCLAPLGELQLLTVLESSPKRSGGTRASVRVHTGPRENFEVLQVDVRSGEPLFPASSYLATLDYRHLLELSPLLRLQLCPRCDREEIFLTENLVCSGATQQMAAISTGHRLRWSLDAEDLPQGLADLLG